MASEDVFTFNFNTAEQELKFTKRSFLKRIAMLFDPLGFLAPFIIRAKILMQEIWIVGVGWDDPLPDEMNKKIKIWFDELKDLGRVKVPRTLQGRGIVKSVSLHTFVDASESAYGAVVYVRTKYDDKVLISLAAAKTKVSPLKAVSIPRLELMGAHLGSTLAQSVGKVLSITKQQMIFWSDSMDVLWWIRGYSRVYKPFVANRVGDIQSCSDPEQWRYVPTGINPADYLTRGLRATELDEKKNWWAGPEYLQSPEEEWPVNKGCKPSGFVVKEMRKKYVGSRDGTSLVISNVLCDKTEWRLDPKRYSSWTRFLIVYSWVNRFISNCVEDEKHRVKGGLTLNELNDVEKIIVKDMQRKEYAKEYLDLQKGKNLSQTQ